MVNTNTGIKFRSQFGSSLIYFHITFSTSKVSSLSMEKIFADYTKKHRKNFTVALWECYCRATSWPRKIYFL